MMMIMRVTAVTKQHLKHKTPFSMTKTEDHVSTIAHIKRRAKTQSPIDEDEKRIHDGEGDYRKKVTQ